MQSKTNAQGGSRTGALRPPTKKKGERGRRCSLPGENRKIMTVKMEIARGKIPTRFDVDNLLELHRKEALGHRKEAHPVGAISDALVLVSVRSAPGAPAHSPQLGDATQCRWIQLPPRRPRASGGARGG